AADVLEDVVADVARFDLLPRRRHRIERGARVAPRERGERRVDIVEPRLPRRIGRLPRLRLQPIDEAAQLAFRRRGPVGFERAAAVRHWGRDERRSQRREPAPDRRTRRRRRWRQGRRRRGRQRRGRLNRGGRSAGGRRRGRGDDDVAPLVDSGLVQHLGDRRLDRQRRAILNIDIETRRGAGPVVDALPFERRVLRRFLVAQRLALRLDDRGDGRRRKLVEHGRDGLVEQAAGEPEGDAGDTHRLLRGADQAHDPGRRALQRVEVGEGGTPRLFEHVERGQEILALLVDIGFARERHLLPVGDAGQRYLLRGQRIVIGHG